MDKDTRYGCVITFPKGTTKRGAEEICERIVKEMGVGSPIFGGVEGFNPLHGGPVWYVP